MKYVVQHVFWCCIGVKYVVFGVNRRSFRGVRRGFWRENGNLVCFFVVNSVEIPDRFACSDIPDCFACLDVLDRFACSDVPEE